VEPSFAAVRECLSGLTAEFHIHSNLKIPFTSAMSNGAIVHVERIMKIITALAVAAALGCAILPSAEAAPDEKRWEITVEAKGEHCPEGWSVAIPSAEVKYQATEALELSSTVSYMALWPVGQPAKSGIGTGEFGLVWRLVDVEPLGFELAFAPEYARRIVDSSVRRGIISGDQELMLGAEAKLNSHGAEFEIKVGRNFIERGDHEWRFESKAKLPCGTDLLCVFRTEHNVVPFEPRQTMLLLGVEWALNDKVALTAAAGREVGRRTSGQVDRALRAGLKFSL
jgi:hypothetical protein